MAATALLKQVAHPTDEQIAAAMVNLCRCGTYNAISAAVHDLAGDGAVQTAAAADLTEQAPAHATGKAVAATAIALTGIGALGVMLRRKSRRVDDEAGEEARDEGSDKRDVV